MKKNEMSLAVRDEDNLPEEISQVLEVIIPTSGGKQVASTLVALVTGIVNEGKKGGVNTLSRVIQAGLQGQFWEQLGGEIKVLIEKGRLKEESTKTPSFRDSMIALLLAIEKDGITEEKFLAMKALFFKMAEGGLFDDNSPMPYLMMKTLSELSSLEVLVLRAAYVATGRMPYAEGQNKVLTKIVEGSGIAREYVDSAWQDLGTRKLLLKGTGLTHLGVKLCEYIEEYEPPVLG
jgi:hypothetical protein